MSAPGASIVSQARQAAQHGRVGFRQYARRYLLQLTRLMPPPRVRVKLMTSGPERGSGGKMLIGDWPPGKRTGSFLASSCIFARSLSRSTVARALKNSACPGIYGAPGGGARFADALCGFDFGGGGGSGLKGAGFGVGGGVAAFGGVSAAEAVSVAMDGGARAAPVESSTKTARSPISSFARSLSTMFSRT